MWRYWRIFWRATLVLEGDGWYYWIWENCWRDDNEMIFAGYNRKAITTEKSSWETLKAMIHLDKKYSK